MSPEEIWNYAKNKGYDKESGLKGKTPWRAIGSQMYVSIQKDPDTIFLKVSPNMFTLKDINYIETDDETIPRQQDEHEIKANERDFHPLLVAFVNSDSHFRSHTKTIHHENSSKGPRNSEKWMHPDLVSVRLPYGEISQSSIVLAKNAGIELMTIFSFEMKKEITSTNVRECYFQAVSNSTWANEGYLVAPRISDQALAQLSRLNSSFGIGVIKLNVDDVHQSEIVFPSRENNIDINMIDELSRINKDFSSFIASINDSMQVGHFVEGGFDAVLEDEELIEYIIRKKIDKYGNA